MEKYQKHYHIVKYIGTVPSDENNYEQFCSLRHYVFTLCFV